MHKFLFTVPVLAAAILAGCASPAPAPKQPVKHAGEGHAPVGYTDTPMLPSGKWHVHDPDRPRPAVVTSGATFSQGAAAPSDAIVLFDGTDLSKWDGEK